MLSKSDESPHPCLFSDFKRKAVSHSLLSMALAIGSLSLSTSGNFPVATLLGVYTLNECYSFSNAFCHKIVVFFFYTVNMLDYTD